MENKMQTTRAYWGSIGVMQNKMETIKVHQYCFEFCLRYQRHWYLFKPLKEGLSAGFTLPGSEEILGVESLGVKSFGLCG